MTEEEYEVDFISEACVQKKSGRGKGLVWSFRVRWKGYSVDDDTWEPMESFVGSEGIVERFWERTGESRDFRDISQFRLGEEFVPKGPPRKKLKRKSVTQQAEETETLSHATESSPKFENITPIEISHPPSKRRRGLVDYMKEERPMKRSKDDLVSAINSQSRLNAVSPPRKKRNTPSPGKGKAAITAPSPELIPDSDEEIENAMRIDQDISSKSTSRNQSPTPLEQSDGRQESFNPLFDEPKTKTEHRRRANNTLVKIFDDPKLAVPTGQLSAKTRALEQSKATGSRASASTSRALPPLPVRSSRKAKASLLTANKNGLTTVKGQYTTQGSSRGGQIEDGASDDEIQECLPPPNAQELLALAGLNSRDAHALPDFPEDVTAEPVDEAQRQEILTAQEAPERSGSLNMAKESLFPSPMLPLPTANEPAWKNTTIFGPLGLGRKISDEADPTSTDTVPFSLNLDSAVIIPTFIANTLPPGSKLLPDISVRFQGPPGKFYSSEAAMGVLDAIRAGSGYGRVAVRSDAPEDMKQQFARFSKRLEQCDLFIGSSGTQSYAFCTPANSLACQRLNIPPSLQALPRNHVLVSKVMVENYSGYAEVAARADSRPWPQYVASLSE